MRAWSFTEDYNTVYRASFEAIHAMGKVTYEDKKEGIIAGKAEGASIKVKLKKLNGKMHATVSARGLLRPKPDAAGGVLYEIHRQLEK